MLFFLAFLLVHFSYSGFWAADDSYYHAKHAFLMQQSGDYTILAPWLEFHFLKYAPADSWWGYHVILAALIRFFGIMAGTKILAAALAALVFAVFYWLLRRFSVKKPFVWTALFFFSSAYLEFRLMNERPFTLAQIFLPLAAYLVVRKKNLWLFLLSLVFALLYNLSPLIILTAFLYLPVQYFFRRPVDLKPLLSTTAGVIAGIMLHPESLNYLNVIVIHLWRVLYLKLTGVYLGLATELQTISFFQFVNYNSLSVILFVLAVATYLAFYFRRPGRAAEAEDGFLAEHYLFLISSAWFLVTLVVPRAADFWLPFCWLFAALVIDRFSRTGEFALVRDYSFRRLDRRVAAFFLSAGFLLVVFNNLMQVAGYKYNQMRSVDQDYYYQEAAGWLKANSRPGEVVFYDNWSYWPRLFFYNDYNHYITGMDPTFLYEYDPASFWLWFNIAKRGAYCDRPDTCPDSRPREKISLIAPAINEKFRSEYVLAENNPENYLNIVMDRDRAHFKKVFENKKLLIYRLILAGRPELGKKP